MHYSPIRILAAAVLGTALLTSAPAHSADNDALSNLLKVLHDKGTLSDSEYQALVQAAAEDQAEASKSDSRRTADAGPADWTSRVKLEGDIRNRFESNSTDGKTHRNRERLRYRLGIIAEPTEHVEVGAGLASGGSDPRSTNQTYSDAFSSKGINLDYAYGQVRYDNFAAVAGKFNPWGKYLYTVDDLMWDDDIRPEGLSAKYDFSNGLGKTFVNGGVWVLGEFSNSSEDPYMAYAQLGQTFGDDGFFATVAGTYYDFISVRPGATSALADSNIGQFSAGSNTDYRFDAVAIDAEIGSKRLFGGAWSGSLFGNVVNNTNLDNQDGGFSVGAKLGTGPWSFKYIYANLDTNAWLDIFPDSDRFGGATDVRAHEGAVKYAVNKYVDLGIDFYHSTQKSTDVSQNLLQADVVFKF